AGRRRSADPGRGALVQAGCPHGPERGRRRGPALRSQLETMSKWSVRGRSALLAVLSIVMTALGGMVGGCSGRLPNLISKDQEIQLGQQYAAQVEQQNRIITSGPQAERLQRAADRIIPLARADWDVPYTVRLIDSNQINAFALPGGPIFF